MNQYRAAFSRIELYWSSVKFTSEEDMAERLSQVVAEHPSGIYQSRYRLNHVTEVLKLSII